jgi:hypothetical protein
MGAEWVFGSAQMAAATPLGDGWVDGGPTDGGSGLDGLGWV